MGQTKPDLRFGNQHDEISPLVFKNCHRILPNVRKDFTWYILFLKMFVSSIYRNVNTESQCKIYLSL